MILETNKELLVRKEKFGLLIFSPVTECYLIINNQFEDDSLWLYLKENIRLGIQNIQEYKIEIQNKDFENELRKIGFGSYKIRLLDNSNSNNYLSAPLEAYFDFTNKCNLRCKHCYNIDQLGNNTMNSEKVTDIIQQLYDMGVMRLHLAGGEPTLEHNGLINYLSSATRRGLITSMSTNGTLVNEKILEEIFSFNIYGFTVSIDGMSETKNDSIRGKGHFFKAKHAIAMALSIKKRLGVSTGICMKSVCTPDMTYEDIKGFVKIAKNIGVEQLKLYSPERSIHHEKGFYGKQIDEYYSMIENMKIIQNEFKNEIKVSPVYNPIIGSYPIGIPGIKGCVGANELITINPDGTISPCLMLHENLGNIYDRTLRDFWENSVNLTSFKKLIEYDDCNNCEYYRFCRGGCQVRKQVEYGKIEKKDPFCPKDYLKKYPEKRSSDISSQKFKYLNYVSVIHSL